MTAHDTGRAGFLTLAIFAVACAGEVRLTSGADGSAEGTAAGAGGGAEGTCDLRPRGASHGVLVVLEPAADNPATCAAPAACEVWFGHGQHLRCPRYQGPPSPIEVACDIWECVCDDGAGFVADFAANEAVDRRSGEECRYTIVIE
jgi:hypothetical protein